MAVRQNIRNREFFEPRSAGCLDNANVSDVMRSQGIKSDLKLFHVAGDVVLLENTVCDSSFFRSLKISAVGFTDFRTMEQIHPAFMQFDHN